jgi:hypothetical protein
MLKNNVRVNQIEAVRIKAIQFLRAEQAHSVQAPFSAVVRCLLQHARGHIDAHHRLYASGKGNQNSSYSTPKIENLLWLEIVEQLCVYGVVHMVHVSFASLEELVT